MRNESALTVRFKIDFILIVLLIIVAAFAFVASHPFETSASDERGTAQLPPQMGHGEVLLVLPAQTNQADTFDALDFSFAWYNALTQEIGPFSIALPNDVNEQLLSDIRLIVVPKRAAVDLTETQIATIEAAVTRGASLLIEMPTPAWAALTSIRQKSQSNSTIKRFTDAPNSPLPTSLRDTLLNFPLETQVLRIDSLDNEALGRSDLLLELDGAIAHYHRPHGAGHVFILAFDMGEALTALQQGRPSDNFKIEINEDEAHATPAHLVLNDKLKTNLIPFADVLKRHVFASIWRLSPQPTLWPFPNAERSALLLTHDADAIGDANYILQEEKQSAAVSTILASTDKTTSKWLSTISETGSEVGTLIVRPPVRKLWRNIGPSFFSPVRAELNAESQRNIISNRAKRNVTTCRLAAQSWAADYTTSFRILTKALCKIDLTYGPADGMYGYLFGTGFPFLPLDRGGLPFPVYEIPTLLSDNTPTPIDPAIAVKLLKESAELYHEPLVFNFSADTMREHPHFQAIDAWLQLIEQAAATRTRFYTVQNYMQYYSTRKQAQLQSTFNDQTRLLDIHTELPTLSDNFTLSLPTRTLYGAIHAITVDQNPIDPKALNTAVNGSLTLLPLTSGGHRILVQYD